MRYMFLIYSQETDSATAEELSAVFRGHQRVMEESSRQRAFVAADPLQRSMTATTVRTTDGKSVITDGPYAETKEQLAGYYILDCENLDDAIAWATKIPTGCQGGTGCIEIRPLREMSNPPKPAE